MSDLHLAVLPASADIGDPHDRALAAALRARIEGEVRFGRHDRLLYATDASIFQVEPMGVALPRSLDDLRAVVRFAAERGLVILPRGGGTSLAGQAVNRALVIDCSKFLRSVTRIDAEARRVTVEPGAVLDDLNRALAPHGLVFGPDVATSGHATLGGMIGNNSAGARSILYGRTVEHVIALRAMLADGSEHVFEEGAGERDPVIRDLTARVAAIVQRVREPVRARYPKIVRRVNGYNLDLILDQIERSTPGTLDRVNLAHLLCGSEGTLAVTMEATLNAVPLPARRGLAIVAFDSVDAALAMLAPVLATKPSAVELLDDVVIEMARANTGCRGYVDLLPRAAAGRTDAVLYVEYSVDADAALSERFAALRAGVGDAGMQVYTDPAAMMDAWTLRRSGEPLLHAIPGNRKPVSFIEDTAVDPARLAAFVHEFRAIVARHGTRAAYYAHASVGCLHIRPLIDLHEADDLDRMEAIAREVTDLVVRFGGALSGEHGDGRARSHLLERFYGPEIIAAFRDIKRLFDPGNRLNPGNIVDPSPHALREHLRVSPLGGALRVPDGPTFFHYEHGLREAVEQCNGAGLCRRTRGGTMCPSYRASLDERHSTRGRGNALRLAITGQAGKRETQRAAEGHGEEKERDQKAEVRGQRSDIRRPAPRSADGSFLDPQPSPSLGASAAASPVSAWDDAETLATLDLCLSCKACKHECPSNVDIAKLKAEYLGQRFAAGARVPLATRLIGRVRALNRIGSALYPLTNLLTRFPPTAWLIRRAMNIDARRSLPRFGPSLLTWRTKRERAIAPDLSGGEKVKEAPALVLLPDCFTCFNEPHIGRAAIRVLEHLGYRVMLPNFGGGPAGCCGRSLISVGMMREAVDACRATAAALLDLVQRERPVAIVAVEPSCLSAIKDDWLDLTLGLARDRLRELADRAWLVEEFIAARWDEHPRDRRSDISHPRGEDAARAVVAMHQHCHHKAVLGPSALPSLLRRLLGPERVRVLDSGCCGLAGGFGYAPHRFDLSMAIGEQSLLPAVREAGEESAVILANGTSCRHQIRDGAGMHPEHPIEWLARLLNVGT